ncbi:hypothetical protein [Brevibacillus daliensis]|uniref:hypothetical protein n=1 Tax=Brevibacillus daliensis TaxID=2892995 RepID=UPI001E4DF923|nr:hypothetical protein [Brevibacillus daliensis]
MEIEKLFYMYDFHDSLINKIEYKPDDNMVVISLDLLNWRQRGYKETEPEIIPRQLIFKQVSKFEISSNNISTFFLKEYNGDEILEVDVNSNLAVIKSYDLKELNLILIEAKDVEMLEESIAND